jgi:predicted RNA-binding protein
LGQNNREKDEERIVGGDALGVTKTTMRGSLQHLDLDELKF